MSRPEFKGQPPTRNCKECNDTFIARSRGNYYCSRCSDKISVHQRFYRKHKAKMKIKTKLWSSKNREKINLYAQIARHKLKKEIFEYYGNKCACCDESTLVFLSLDHKNNDGASHRRRLSGTNAGFSHEVYKDVRRQGFPDTYQILCHNCNRAKYILGECPHKEAMKTK
jgi:hypothetical protein